MKQIKKLVAMIEAANDKCNEELKQTEAIRTENLAMIGNLVDSSVPISNDEVCYSYLSCSYRCTYAGTSIATTL